MNRKYDTIKDEIVRQYFPKKAVYGKITESDIKRIQNKLNNRSRKRLNYLTPHEVVVLGIVKESIAWNQLARCLIINTHMSTFIVVII